MALSLRPRSCTEAPSRMAAVPCAHTRSGLSWKRQRCATLAIGHCLRPPGREISQRNAPDAFVSHTDVARERRRDMFAHDEQASHPARARLVSLNSKSPRPLKVAAPGRCTGGKRSGQQSHERQEVIGGVDVVPLQGQDEIGGEEPDDLDGTPSPPRCSGARLTADSAHE